MPRATRCRPGPAGSGPRRTAPGRRRRSVPPRPRPGRAARATAKLPSVVIAAVESAVGAGRRGVNRSACGSTASATCRAYSADLAGGQAERMGRRDDRPRRRPDSSSSSMNAATARDSAASSYRSVTTIPAHHEPSSSGTACHDRRTRQHDGPAGPTAQLVDQQTGGLGRPVGQRGGGQLGAAGAVPDQPRPVRIAGDQRTEQRGGDATGRERGAHRRGARHGARRRQFTHGTDAAKAACGPGARAGGRSLGGRGRRRQRRRRRALAARPAARRGPCPTITRMWPSSMASSSTRSPTPKASATCCAAPGAPAG